jgi:hypothetical protein
MSGARKHFEQMARNPKDDWTVSDIQTVCQDNDLTCEPPSEVGSHWKVSSPYLDEILTIPARRPIKPVYVDAFVGFVLKSREVR